MRPARRRGWLGAFRRLSFLAPVVLATIVIVAFARGEALARAIGDDDVCSAMSFAAVPPPSAEDPADLSDHRHACCDLGLCLDGGALPVAATSLATVPARRPRVPASRPVRPTVHRRRAGFRPRDPPAA